MTKNIKEEGFCVAQMDTVKYAEIMEECKVDMEDMWLDISGVNSPKQTCVVGHLKYINKFSGKYFLFHIFLNNISISLKSQCTSKANPNSILMKERRTRDI